MTTMDTRKDGIMNPITADQAGTWFEGTSLRTASQLSTLIIGTAIEHGWELNESQQWAWGEVQTDESTNTSKYGTWHCEDDGLSEELGELADYALDYLNSIAPVEMTFVRDDGLFLMGDDEEGGELL